jgi:hypothetical protein
MEIGSEPRSDPMPSSPRYCRLDKFPIDGGRLPLKPQDRISRYISEPIPPMEEGSEPRNIPYNFNDCRLDRLPIDDGRLPLMTELDICKYLSELKPPMLLGKVPVTEPRLSKYRY